MTVVLPSGAVSVNAYVKSYCGSSTILLSKPVRPEYSVIIARALKFSVANSPRSPLGGVALCLTMSLFVLSSPAWRRLSVIKSAGVLPTHG